MHTAFVQSKSKLQQELSLDDAECVVADVANVDLSSAMTGCHALIVATSATPKIDYWSMPGFLWNKFVMKKRVMPNFTFPQRPEQARPRHLQSTERFCCLSGASGPGRAGACL